MRTEPPWILRDPIARIPVVDPPPIDRALRRDHLLRRIGFPEG
jgi:hypothetical protein